jgi:hypothetical protein
MHSTTEGRIGDNFTIFFSLCYYIEVSVNFGKLTLKYSIVVPLPFLHFLDFFCFLFFNPGNKFKKNKNSYNASGNFFGQVILGY